MGSTNNSNNTPVWIAIENMRGNEIEVKDRKLVKCKVNKDVVLRDIDEVACWIKADNGAIVDIPSGALCKGNEWDINGIAKVHTRGDLKCLFDKYIDYTDSAEVICDDENMGTDGIIDTLIYLWEEHTQRLYRCNIELDISLKLNYADSYKIFKEAIAILKDRYIQYYRLMSMGELREYYMQGFGAPEYSDDKVVNAETIEEEVKYAEFIKEKCTEKCKLDIDAVDTVLKELQIEMRGKEVPYWANAENLKGNRIVVDGNKLVKCNIYTDTTVYGIDEIDCDINYCGNGTATLDIMGDVKFKKCSMHSNSGILNVLVHRQEMFDVLNKEVAGDRIKVVYSKNKTRELEYAILYILDNNENKDSVAELDIWDNIKIDNDLSMNYEDTYKVFINIASRINRKTKFIEYITNTGISGYQFDSNAIKNVMNNLCITETPIWVTLANMRGNEIEVEGRTLVKCHVNSDVVIQDIDEIDCDIIPISGYCIALQNRPTVTITGDVMFDKKFEDAHYRMDDINLKIVVENKNTFNRITNLISDELISFRYNPVYGNERVSEVRYAILRYWDTLTHSEKYYREHNSRLNEEPIVWIKYALDWELDYEDTCKAIEDSVKLKVDEWVELYGSDNVTSTARDCIGRLKQFIQKFRINEKAVEELSKSAVVPSLYGRIEVIADASGDITGYVDDEKEKGNITEVEDIPDWVDIEREKGNIIEIEDHKLVKCELYNSITIRGIDGIQCLIRVHKPDIVVDVPDDISLSADNQWRFCSNATNKNAIFRVHSVDMLKNVMNFIYPSGDSDIIAWTSIVCDDEDMGIRGVYYVLKYLWREYAQKDLHNCVELDVSWKLSYGDTYKVIKDVIKEESKNYIREIKYKALNWIDGYDESTNIEQELYKKKLEYLEFLRDNCEDKCRIDGIAVLNILEELRLGADAKTPNWVTDENIKGNIIKVIDRKLVECEIYTDTIIQDIDEVDCYIYCCTDKAVTLDIIGDVEFKKDYMLIDGKGVLTIKIHRRELYVELIQVSSSQNFKVAYDKNKADELMHIVIQVLDNDKERDRVAKSTIWSDISIDDNWQMNYEDTYKFLMDTNYKIDRKQQFMKCIGNNNIGKFKFNADAIRDVIQDLGINKIPMWAAIENMRGKDISADGRTLVRCGLNKDTTNITISDIDEIDCDIAERSDNIGFNHIINIVGDVRFGDNHSIVCSTVKYIVDNENTFNRLISIKWNTYFSAERDYVVYGDERLSRVRYMILRCFDNIDYPAYSGGPGAIIEDWVLNYEDTCKVIKDVIKIKIREWSEDNRAVMSAERLTVKAKNYINILCREDVQQAYRIDKTAVEYLASSIDIQSL